MFEVHFRPRRPSDARSERCSKLFLIWSTVIAAIVVLCLFTSRVWAAVGTVLILLFMIGFTWYYFHSAPPEAEPVEESHPAENGLSPSDIAEIPSFAYQRNSRNDLNGSDEGVGWLQCAVCIATVKEGEMVRQLPMCKHVFHVKYCIDKWLGSHSTCPMCRADVKTGELSSEQPAPPV
ncbi:RING/U-box superfamily protein [Rhynchospora pubera]|uniref:RING-type E3 ubiquitin transferase n=1 Tax=Rhynchospora pubera TaxID=906938 RepID=A0AAV8ELA6_9POAL|nr:RING/U-box superfamily protein [Rhynchospora pubera]